LVELTEQSLMKKIIFIFFSVTLLSCTKQESNYDLKVQISSSVMPAYVLLYKNNSFLDTINFQIDGTIGFWEIDEPINTSYSLEVRKLNLKDTGIVNVKWFRTTKIAQQDVLIMDTLSNVKTANFKL